MVCWSLMKISWFIASIQKCHSLLWMNLLDLGFLVVLQQFLNKSFKPFYGFPLAQLHSTSLAFIKFFPYWCEYQRGKLLYPLFHLFKVKCSSTAHVRGHGLINLVEVVRSFGTFLERLRLFLIFRLRKEAHATVIRTKEEDRCISMFPKYSNKGHFLMRNGLYVYAASRKNTTY